MRTRLSSAAGFRELLTNVRETCLESFGHQDLPFEQVVEALQPERTFGQNPFFQVMFVHQPPPPIGSGFAGLDPRPVDLETRTSKFDLTLFMEESPYGLRATFEYDTDLFEARTIESMAGHFERLLEAIVADPELAVGRLPWLTDAERTRILVDWNRTRTSFPRAVCVHRLFEEQASRTPGAAAVLAGGRTTSYAELDRRAATVAAALRRRGVGPDAIVGVCAGRSVGMLAGLLGILKAGGAYLPLDPAYPKQRLAYMMEDSGVRVLLCDAEGLANLPAHDAEVLRLDAFDAGSAGHPEDTYTDPAVQLHHAAYVIYTSGSTGRPKGVVMPHGPLANLIEWQLRTSGDPAAARTLAFSPLSFDVSFQEMLATWAGGGQLALITEALRRDPVALIRFLEKHAVERLFLPFIALQQLAEAAASIDLFPGSVRHIITAGEPLQITPALRRWFERLPDCTLHNQYGPTETHVVTAHTLRGSPGSWSARPPIGRPIANARILLLDPEGAPVPVGVPGELYIGGDVLARGYLNQPELTAERFVPDPYSDEAGARLYRTGDMACFRSDGEILFLGRTDHQVKVRGFRIELGEVESALALHPEVREAVVSVSGQEDKRLVGYVVARTATPPGAEALRSFLSQRLPDYMVPSFFVTLEKLPLTPSGKVDRRALPEPVLDRVKPLVQPRDPVEQRLAAIWKELLGIPEAGVGDDFFEMGGHSLLAVRLFAHIHKEFGRELPIAALIHSPTIEKLAVLIRDGGSKDGSSAVVRVVPRTGSLPLSRAQRQLWLLEQVAPGPACYNMSETFRLEGSLDIGALSAAVDHVVARHEALRAIIETPGNGLEQTFGPPRRGIVRRETLDAVSPEQREGEAMRLVAEDSAARFSLGAGLLLRALVVSTTPDRHILSLTVHHSAGDGVSMGILHRELSAAYRAHLEGRPLEPVGPSDRLDYGDYAAWQAERLTGSRLAELSAWWRGTLAGRPAQLTLPVPPPATQAPGVAGRATRTLDLAITDLVRGLARRTHATPFMVLLAVWQALLARWSGQRDVIVGCSVAGRTLLALDGVVGCFVNILPIRVDLSGEPSLTGLLARVREATLGATSHQELPFIDLVAALGASHERRPVVQVAFALQNFENAPLAFPGVTAGALPSEPGGPRFDLLLVAEEQSGVFTLTLEYDRAIVDHATAERLLDGYTTMLAAGLADPELSVAALPTIPAEERRRVVEDFNRTGTAYPRDATIHQLFREQAERTPDAVAVVFQDRKVTYGQLWDEACTLAARLQHFGVRADDRVAVCMERSERLISVLLGVLAAGACYVPLDPRHPLDRLAATCSDADARCVIAAPDGQALAQRLGPPLLLADEVADHGVLREPGATAGNLAYVCYTSGSTGVPKGVAVTHRGVVRLVRGATYASFDPRHVFLHLSPLAFDASTFEIWGPLLNGGRVVVMPPGTPGLDDIVACIERHGVTSAFFTTGLFNLLVDERLERLASLEQVLFGGEACSPGHVARARRGLPACRLINAYGPTETTTFAVCHDVEWTDAEDGPVPIGRPISNSSAYVLDADGQPLPVGVEGELWLGGDGVARGYLARPELSAERFVPDRFRDGTMYRTGDIARWTLEGRLEYVGRRDDQVKIRGFRVELGEIEQRLIAHADVIRATVGALPDTRGALRLIAWVVSLRMDEGLEQELKSWVAGALPDFMVPAGVQVVADIPLTPNGKVDRAALPVPGVVKSVPAAPRNDLERRLVTLWEEVLEVGDIGIHDPFFDLGGHSLLAVKLAARIESELAIRVPLVTFYEARTVAEFARRVQSGVWTEADGLLMSLQPHGERPPIFWVHSLGGDRTGSFMYYRQLAQLLGPDQPSYGIRAPEAPHTTVEAMAADYIRAIEAFRPEGPVLLGGFCFGGNVAFEMARQLTRAGRAVPFLVMIESAVPRHDARPSGWKATAGALRRESIRGAYRRASRALGRLLRGDPKSEGVWDYLDRSLYPEDCAHAAEVHFEALRAYRPERLDGGAVLVRQADTLDYGWDGLARDGVLELGFDSSHEDLVRSPIVEVVADSLRELIQERLPVR